MSDTHPEGHTHEMREEYDFSRGVRGTHAKACRNGYTVVIHRADGSLEERDVVFPEGIVTIDPDVRPYFPDSDAVNRALRGLLDLVPHAQTAESSR